MKKFFNWVIVLAAIAGAFYCVGLIVPRSITSGSKTNLTTKPDQVLAVVSDVAGWPKWHPDILSVVPRERRSDHPVWHVTEKGGTSFDIEVLADEEATWQGSYTIDDTRYLLRFDFGWFAEGGRVRLIRTIDTRDTWKRAKSFLWSRSETSPIGLLNALAEYLGEHVKVEET